MKKIITAVLAVTMAVGMLTGCGSGSGTGKKEASGEKLVIWTNMNVEVDTIQKYADEWGEKTTNHENQSFILMGKRIYLFAMFHASETKL